MSSKETWKKELIQTQIDKLNRLLEMSEKQVNSYQLSIWLHEQELIRMDEDE